MYLLTAAIDWGEVGAIVGILAILAGIGAAIYTVRKTRLKAKVNVKAVRDETGYVEVVVSNEKGTNPITITSVTPVLGKDAFRRFPPEAKKLGAGQTEKWHFDLGRDAPKDVKIRADTGEKHWTAKPKNVAGVIERASTPASAG